MIKRVPLFSFFSELILIFLIIFGPFNYGSYTSFSQTILQLTSFFIFFILLIRLAVISKPKVIYPPAIAFMICFFAVILFQLIPFSQETIRALSPQTLQLYKQYLPSIEETSRHTLSIYPFATKNELVRFFAVFVLFLVTINVMDNKRKFERVLAIIVLWAAGIAFYGIMKKFFISGGWVHSDLSFSTFSHKNLYAGYMVMIAPLSVGYALACRDMYKRVFFGFLAAVISVSIFITLSRGGSLSLIFALLLLVFLSIRKFSIKDNLWIIAIIVIIIVILSAIIGMDALMNRISDLFGQTGFDSRIKIIKDSLPLLKDFFLFGIGLGGAPYIITRYQTLGYYMHLHNDHFQLLVETGFVGSIFCLLFFIMVFKNILMQLRKTQDPFVRNVVAGGVSGLVAISLHAIVDAVLHTPASLFMFWLILGLTYRCVYSKFVYERDRT